MFLPSPDSVSRVLNGNFTPFRSYRACRPTLKIGLHVPRSTGFRWLIASRPRARPLAAFPSDWIVGRLGRFNPPVHFSTPQLALKNYLAGVRLNPPEQHSISQCRLSCSLLASTDFQHVSSSGWSEAMTVLWIIYLFTSVDVAHADVLFLYIYATYTAM